MPYAQEDFPPFVLTRPKGDAIPLVCDSPHSGTNYPADFRPALDMRVLRSGEDTYVEELWREIPEAGGTLLAAQFPRTYVDPNREPDDIDAGMLDGVWPGTLNPTEKTRTGHGLVWRSVNGQPIYNRLLGVDEVLQRIRRYHQPYHAALGREIAAAFERFGAVWYLNLHSMPADSYALMQLDSDHQLADFVLGDRDGTTCAPAFVELVEQVLAGHGYSVARNEPFKGVALISRLGNPARRLNSLQIEVNRSLYMNEDTRERNDGFAALQTALADVARQVSTYIRKQL